MTESTRFFEGRSGLQRTLSDLAKALDELGISYVVVGGMALTAHGYARMTEDIDLLVTRPALTTIHDSLVGRGYVRLFSGSKNIRDTRTGVKIEFVLTGDFPGNGEEQPVSFPAPADAEPFDLDGVKYVGLTRLIELKLASGMSGGPDRAKDLVDVQQLITILRLERDLPGGLQAEVREMYRELWDGLRAAPKRYVRLWRNQLSTLDAGSIEDMIAILGDAAEELRRMKEDGVTLDQAGGTGDDYACLVTTDPVVADRYDMHPDSEFFGEGGDPLT